MYNKQWQLSLCAILLVTFSACNYDSKNAAMVATDSVAAAPADVQLQEIRSEEFKMEEVPGNEGIYKNVNNADKGAPPQEKDKRQSPAPQQQRQQQVPQQPAVVNPDWNKKIIKNATLSVEVKDYLQFNRLVHDAVQQAGGYVAQEEQGESDYKIENTVTIKVPVEQFDKAVLALTPGKEKILVKKITSQDVTGEVVDTKSRLEAKRQARARYLDFLKQAKNMEEILQVQSEIDEIQENMEAAAGRVNYLTHAAAYSTIQLSYFQVMNPQAKEVDTPPGFGQKVLLALTAGLQWVGEFLLLLITIWPVWLLVLTGIWLYRRYRAAKKVVPVTQAVPSVDMVRGDTNQGDIQS
jgi:hypothetical protein